MFRRREIYFAAGVIGAGRGDRIIDQIKRAFGRAGSKVDGFLHAVEIPPKCDRSTRKSLRARTIENMKGDIVLETPLGQQMPPEVSAQQQKSAELVERLRKLRWLGMEDQAERLQMRSVLAVHYDDTD